MRVLILGANGFIGKHMSSGLEQIGYKVVRADITNGGDNTCIVYDAGRPDFFAIFSAEQYDVCINCSGAASVPESVINPYNDFTLNTVRIAKMLDALRQKSPKTKFIHLSSAAVYGSPTKFPIVETDTLKPVSPYGWHKLQAEEICREYSTLHGINTLSLRIFSAYGPGLRKQLFWDVYQKGLKNDSIELFGTGNETRDFIYVEDITNCIDILIKKAIFDGRAVNVANGEAVTVKAAVTTLIDAIGWQRKLAFSGTERVGDPQYWQADISYMKELGFLPKFSLTNGLAVMAKWIQMEY